MSRRRCGAGSIYRRTDGRWVFAWSQMRARRCIYSTTLCGLLSEMARLNLGADGAYGGVGRGEAMRIAKGRGSHSAAEWAAYVKSAGALCEYCGRPCGSRATKDHRTPVSRGGSDSMDNLAVACQPCNWRKGTSTETEFRAWMAANPAAVAEMRAAALPPGHGRKPRGLEPPVDADGWLSLREVCRRLSLSDKSVRLAVRDGELDARRGARGIRVNPASIPSFIAGLKPVLAEK